MHHLQEVFGRLKDHDFKLHLGIYASFSKFRWNLLGHMIHLGGLGVQKAKVEAISHVSQPTYVSLL
jgi:hypothetical protein